MVVFLGLLDQPLLPKGIQAVDQEGIQAMDQEDDIQMSSQFYDDTHVQEAEEDSGERISAVVELAQTPCEFEFCFKYSFNKIISQFVTDLYFSIAPRRLRTLSEMGEDIGHPELPDLVAIFLFHQRNPTMDLPDISRCPRVTDRGYSFNSAIATFYAPSDLSGPNGMHKQRIHATSSWRNGPPHYHCVFVENDYTLPGFQGLYVAQVLLFFL